MPNSIIISTGCCIPDEIIPNTHFMDRVFYGADGVRMEKPTAEIIERLYQITGIRERRYASDDQTTTDIAYAAAVQALEGIDRESLDYVIVAQNFGGRPGRQPADGHGAHHCLAGQTPASDQKPLHRCLRHPLRLSGLDPGHDHADYYIRSGDARRVLVIGAEILSRVSDPHDVDSMIFADGAGATLVGGIGKSRGDSYSYHADRHH
jgi:3-oxoacyl-[acyl-carrier-protein] synthase-3